MNHIKTATYGVAIVIGTWGAIKIYKDVKEVREDRKMLRKVEAYMDEQKKKAEEKK